MSAKTVVSCVIVTGVAVVGSILYGMNAEKKAYELATISNQNLIAENEELAQKLSNTGASAPVMQEITGEITAVDPAVLIRRLIDLQETNPKKIREALYCMQGLVDGGTNSIVPIRGYIEGGYNVSLRNGGNNRGGGFGGPGGFGRGNNDQNSAGVEGVPATTRMGIVAALKDIGTKEAVTLIAQILPVSQNVAELIYTANQLMEIDTGTFRDTIVVAARNMLAVTENNGEKRQLYDLLAKLGDTQMAQDMLANLYVDGRLDMSALDFVKKTLGEGIVPVLSGVFNDPNASDRDKGVAMMNVMDYVGGNAEANSMYMSAFNSEQIKNDPRLQSMMVIGLTGIQMNGENNLTATAAEQRLALIDTIRQSAGDNQALTRALNAVEDQLLYKIDPSAFESAPQMDFGALMGGGNNNNRGGREQGGPGGFGGFGGRGGRGR